VLGVAPELGREFTADEDRAGGPPAVILSAELWRLAFGADRGVVGRTVVLRGEPHTVVGVMPGRFRSSARADLWTPLRPSTTGEGGGENYHILVRVRGDAAWSQAVSEVARAGDELQRERPLTAGREISFSLMPLQRGLTDSLRQPLVILWAAVGIVLLVACVNLAGLLIARGATRTREIATRMALGSGRSAVLRQMLVEAGMLAGAGGILGTAAGVLALDAMRSLAAGIYDIWQPVSVGPRAIGAALTLSLTAWICFGLAPAIQASRLDVRAGMIMMGARSIAGGSSRWPRRILVVAQVALGVLLLVAAGLLLRTFAHLRSLDPGFDPEQMVTASVSLEDARYQGGASVVRLFEDTLVRIRQAGGVESAAVSLGLPYERLLNLGFRHADGPEASESAGHMTSATYVSSGFFRAMRMPVRSGREFDERDRAGSTPVVIVNDAFARTYYGNADPIGRHIRLSGASREVIGVVGSVQLKPGWGDNGPLAAMPLAYIPLTQVSDGFVRLVHGWFSPTFIVRASLPVSESEAVVRRALDSVDPLLPFAEVRSMSAVRSSALAEQRLLMALLVGLAAAAVALAAIGLHGLMASSVTERTREMGIRLALGSTSAQALRSLALPGIVLAAIGTAVGLVSAAAAARLMRSFVWGITTSDPLTFVSVTVLLLLVASTTSLLPALSILRLDPATTLRHE
jgi:predicted permease